MQDDVEKIKQNIDKTKTDVNQKLERVTSQRQLLQRVQNTVSSSDIAYMATILKNRNDEIVMDTTMPADAVFKQTFFTLDVEMFNRLQQDIASFIKPSVPDMRKESAETTNESKYEVSVSHDFNGYVVKINTNAE